MANGDCANIFLRTCFFTACQGSCRKVMFSVAFACSQGVPIWHLLVMPLVSHMSHGNPRNSTPPNQMGTTPPPRPGPVPYPHGDLTIQGISTPIPQTCSHLFNLDLIRRWSPPHPHSHHWDRLEKWHYGLQEWVFILPRRKQNVAKVCRRFA